MWTRVSPELPPHLDGVTTSVWAYSDIMQVGVMRYNFLAPPILWAQLLRKDRRELRNARIALDVLQETINAPEVQAEAALDSPGDQKFLLHLGFIEQPLVYARKLYSRSI